MKLNKTLINYLQRQIKNIHKKRLGNFEVISLVPRAYCVAKMGSIDNPSNCVLLLPEIDCTNVDIDPITKEKRNRCTTVHDGLVKVGEWCSAVFCSFGRGSWFVCIPPVSMEIIYKKQNNKNKK